MAVKQGQYRGVSSADRRADRRARLLAATLEVWGREGGPTITMTRICAEAGLTERYFYENFSGLDAALVAVMESIADEIADATVSTLAATAGGPTERVRAAIGAFVRILTDDPRKGRVLIVEAISWDALRPRRSELLQQFAQLSAFEAQELYGPKAWTSVEGRLAATMFIGGVAELVSGWLQGAVEASPTQIVEAATLNFTATAHR